MGKRQERNCEICSKKVNSIDELTTYDGLLVDTGYLTCDKCTKILERTINQTIKGIRDRKFYSEGCRI